MNAKSLKSYPEKFSGDDLSRVHRKFEITPIRRGKKKKTFIGTAVTLLHLKALPQTLLRTKKAHVGSGERA